MTQETPAVNTSGSEGRLLRGCLLGGVLAALVVTGALGAWWYLAKRAEEAALAAQAQTAEEEFAPVLEALGVAAKPGPRYDIDKTMRVIHEIDRAMRDAKSVPEFLAAMQGQDYRDVAPEVLEARRRILEILMRLYARQAEKAQQDEMWALSSQTVLQLLSLVKPGESLVTGVSYDQAQAKELLRQVEEQREVDAALLRELHAVEAELLAAMLKWSEAYYPYAVEWDRLCNERDQAYLAVARGDWPAAAAAARSAVELSPSEREAHLLLALAAIEGGPDVAQDLDPGELLAAYRAEHPDGDAPAWLLEGVLARKRGDDDAAGAAFQMAAAHYPRQAAQLGSLVDPYRARSFLRKTPEGLYVVELYSATMAGAGYFSPDLQLARSHFDGGRVAEGRQKVMDHFFRRRQQQEWEFLLEDIDFAEDFIGPQFHAIFPEEPWLDLVAQEALLGGKLALSVKNRSDRTLHNATLLLCLQLTDMHPGDYVVFPAGPTLPAVNAHETTRFETVPVAIDRHGVTKGVDDIVQIRAVLIADEAVTWVDTEEYKLAEVEAAKRAVGAKPAPTAHDRVVSQLVDVVQREASMVANSQLGKDDVVVELPDELAVLSPVFRLKVGDTLIVPETNELRDGHIELRFPNVFNYDDPEQQHPDLEVVVEGLGAQFSVGWTPGQGLEYALQGVAETR